MILRLISRAVAWMIKKLTSIYYWLNQRITPNPYSLDDLSPIDNIENGEPYFKSLEWALENDDIQNIAITGPYGSGKSSVIRSFEKTHSRYKYLNISLASFRDGATKENAGRKHEEITADENRLVEISILQQIFYNVKAGSIPDSRFKRIKSLSGYKLAGNVTLTILGFISLLYFLNPLFFSRFPFWTPLHAKYENTIPYIAAALIILCVAAVFSYCFRLFRSKQFQKVNITSGEIEINADNEKSILNKHLDEILYFFEVTEYNVVIIEDLDRFKDHEIFTKLREINLLLNRSRQVGRKIVFIYALKDDMFLDKTRTKFFEFILPVIPVVNWHNSFSILRDKLKAQESDSIIDEKFIRDITLYIDDMRILKNIFNEFVIYRENLKKLKINLDQLLGLIVYKNIYPTDFAMLHENKGIVYRAFTALKDKKAKKAGEITSRIEELEKMIASAEIEIADNIVELRSIYIQEIFRLQPAVRKIRVGQSYLDAKELNDDQNFNTLTTENRIDVQSDHGTSNTGRKFADIEKMVNPKRTYGERSKAIQAKAPETKNKYKAEIASLNSHRNQINQYSFKEFLDIFPDSLSLFDKDLLEKELLKYLLREGYIDEMYTSLLSYFYEGSLSKPDMDFLLGIKNRTPLDFNLKLSNLEEIVKSITPTQWKSECLLNYHFIDYLISNPSNNTYNLNIIFSQFKTASPHHLNFFFGYYNAGQNSGTFTALLFEGSPDLWKFIVKDSRFTNEFENLIVRLIVFSCSGKTIEMMDADSIFSHYISQKSDFLLSFLEENDKQQVKKTLDNLNVKFKDLVISEKTKDLLKYIYENDYYEINPVMISLMVNEFGDKNITTEQLETANYTTLKQSGCDSLIAYVNDNTIEYSTNVLSRLEKNSKETEESIVTLLNYETIPLPHKEKLIIDSETALNDISALPQEVWDYLINYSKLKITWENVGHYFQYAKTINPSLAKYLNNPTIYEELGKNQFELLSEQINDEAGEQSVAEFSKSLVYSSEISDAAFDHLVRSIPMLLDGYLEFEKISDTRITSLIREKLLSMSPENFSALAFKPDMKLLLIEENTSSLKDDIATYLLQPDDLVMIFSSSKIRSDDKIFILNNTPEDLFTGQPLLSNTICSFASNIAANISFGRLKKILTYATDEKSRLILLINKISDLKIENIDDIFGSMGEPYASLAERNKRPTLALTPEHIELGQKLKDAGYISNFRIEPEENKIRLFNKVS